MYINLISLFLFISSLCTVHAAVTMKMSPMWDEYRHSYCYCYSFYLFFRPSGVQLENSLATLRTVTSHCGSLAAVEAVALQPSQHVVLWLLRSNTWNWPKVKKPKPAATGWGGHSVSDVKGHTGISRTLEETQSQRLKTRTFLQSLIQTMWCVFSIWQRDEADRTETLSARSLNGTDKERRSSSRRLCSNLIRADQHHSISSTDHMIGFSRRLGLPLQLLSSTPHPWLILFFTSTDFH